MTNPERDNFSGGRTSQGTWLVAGSVGAGAVLAAVIFFVLVPGPKEEVPEWVPKGPPPIQMIAVEVQSEPAGAKVFLGEGGVPLAKTPGSVSLMPGVHTLRFELPGFPMQRIPVDTTKDKTALAKWEGVVITLRSKPEGA